MAIRCGNKMAHGADKVTHETVADVRACYQHSAEQAQALWDEQQQANAELEAERRNERWFEERGGGEDDPRERELQMMDDLRRETAAIQAKEREEDERAYRSKMERDEALQAGAVLDRMTGAPGRDMASDKQVKYALDLLATRVWPDTITESDLRNMERRQVSKLIDNLKRAPKKQLELNVDPEVGMYIADDGNVRHTVRVYLGQRSGRNLAKLLVAHEGDGPLGTTYDWDYLGSAQHVASGRSQLGRVKLEKMSLEDAKKWGKLTGFCCACGRRLDVPESVDRGIGPVCAGKDIWA